MNIYHYCMRRFREHSLQQMVVDAVLCSPIEAKWLSNVELLLQMPTFIISLAWSNHGAIKHWYKQTRCVIVFDMCKYGFDHSLSVRPGGCTTRIALPWSTDKVRSSGCKDHVTASTRVLWPPPIHGNVVHGFRDVVGGFLWCGPWVPMTWSMGPVTWSVGPDYMVRGSSDVVSG